MGERSEDAAAEQGAGRARERYDVPLAPLTTMRVGGPARRLVTATSTDELVDAVREVDDADEPLLILSGGSNLVVADAGFDGTVVGWPRPASRVESADLCGGAIVRVAAGEAWDDFVERTVAQGWAGVEALSGIPGRTGATPDPERRRLRPGGRPDDRAGARLGPAASSAVRTFAQRGLRLLLPDSRCSKDGPPGVGTSCSTSTFQLELATSEQADRVRRPGSRPRRRGWARGCRWPPRARRCSTSAAGAGWCSTPPTTTRGAAARSSPTRS